MTTHVLVIRHPDYPTEVTCTDPDAQIHTFDLGSSFDITNLQNQDLQDVHEMALEVSSLIERVPELEPELLSLLEQLTEGG